MLPALLGAGARGLVKGGGRAMAANLTGRKKTVKASAIAPKGAQQQQQQRKGGALVKSPTAAMTKQMAPIQQVSTGPVAKGDYLKSIHTNVLVIEKIVKGIYDSEKDNLKAKKQAEKEDARRTQEEKLETKDKKPDKKKPKMPKVAEVGIFGWIKRFIGNILLGLFLQKAVDFAPMLVGIVKVIDGATTFIADVGVKIIDTLSTFIDWGYKAYDATRGFVKIIGGNQLAENFDKVTGLVGTALTLATAITLDAAADSASGGGDGPGLLDLLKFKKGAAAAKGAATAKGTAAAAAGAKGTAAAGTAGVGGGAAGTAGTVGGVAVGTAAAIIAGVGLLASALGEGAYQIKKIGKKPIDDAQKQFDKYNWLNPMKYFWGAALGMQKMLLFPLTFTGYALDVIGAPFRYAIELIRFGIMALMGDTEGMKKQRTNLAKFDSRIRESVREMLSMLTLGLAFNKKGSFGNIFGDEEAQAEMMKKYAEGGSIKKKFKRGIEIKKTKKRRVRIKKPSIERLPQPPVTSKGSEQKNREWWDFLGWAGTGEQKPLGPGGEQLVEKATNVGNKLGEDDYFGPILRVTSKVILGEEVTSKDYRNIGLGINYLIDTGISKGAIRKATLGYAEGGEVEDTPYLDTSTWVEKSFKKALETDLNKKYITGTTGPQGVGSYDSATGQYMSGTTGSTGGIMGQGVGKGAAIARKLMVDLKISPAAAAGIVGNLMLESGLIPDNVENGKGFEDGPINNVPVGTQRVGYGWGQWTNDRLESFRKFLKSRNAADRPATDDDNYAYLIKELTSTEPIKGHWKGWEGRDIPQDDPARAATWFMMNWERPGVPHQDMRQQYALQIYEKIKGLTQETARAEVAKAIEKTGGAFAPTDSASVGNINVSGSNITNIGKNLISKGFAVAEHPDFTKQTPSGKYTPGAGYVSNVHQGRGHYEGRAIDVTDWRGSMQDSKARYRSVLTSLQDNPAIKMLIHDSWGAMYGGPGTKQGPGSHSHPSHMHIEVKDRGGFIGRGLFANLGGTEFVTDADSTAALRQEAPGLMMALNQAKDRAGIAKVLRQYASYEQGAEQIVMIDDSQDQMPLVVGGGSGSTNVLPIPFDNEDPFEYLDYQG